jgi:hypothetical protein
MIDTPAYEGELIQRIRRDHENGPDGTPEGITSATGLVQDEFRPDRPEGGESGTEGGAPREIATRRRSGAQRREARTGRGDGTNGRSRSRKRRTDTKADQDSSRANRRNRSTDDEIRGPAIEEEAYADEEKPAGLKPLSNARERKIRQEQEEARAAASAASDSQQTKKGLFGWLRPDHSGEKAKNKKPGRVFTEREAGQKRQALIAALTSYFEYADEAIFATVKTHPPVMIWRSIDDEQIAKIADVWLARAQHDAATAGQIDWLLEQHARIEVGIILAPRFIQTIDLYAKFGIGVK